MIVASLAHTCMTVGTEVVCWGLNSSGQLGDGDFENQQVPVYVIDLQNVIDLTAGNYHICTLSDEGEVWCWGENGSGQMENDSTDISLSPVLVVSPRRNSQ